MARVVIFTSGTLGDHLPYLALAQGIQGRGHDVVMVINQAMHGYAERAGLAAVALTDIERGPEEARENAWAWDHWRNPWHAAQTKVKAQPPEVFVRQVRELGELAAGADLLLATAIRPHGLGAHLISGVPWATLSVNPSSFAGSQPAEVQRQAEALERGYYFALRPLLDAALREAGSAALLPDWYRGWLWAPQLILGSSAVFSIPNSDYLLPFTAVTQTGFWFWEDPEWAEWRPSPELDAFASQRPLVLAFSSQPLEDPREILHKHVRAAAQLEMPLIVQRGWAGFDADDLPPEADPKRVLFLDYAPHDWLFARAGAAIQHGGIGSLARALRQFCPLVVEPFGNDQFFNAGRTAELGTGIALHPFECTAEEIAQAVTFVLSRQTRLRAKMTGRALREEDGVGAAVAVIERMLEGSFQHSVFSVQSSVSGRLNTDHRQLNTEIWSPNTEIPHILHQTWKDADVPAHFQVWAVSWRTHHPEWEFRLWTHSDLRALIAERYAWFLPTYDSYRVPIMQADSGRYFVLHAFGGVYADLDTEALRPVEPLLAGRTLVLSPEPPLHIQEHRAKLFLEQMLSNAWMASAPGHPFWEHIFELLVAWAGAPGPLDATGPFLLSRAYKSFSAREMITIEAHQRLSPISSAAEWSVLPPGVRELVARDAYVLHHWYGSWWLEPPVPTGAVTAQLLRGGAPAEAQHTRREALLEHSARMGRRPLISCLMVTRERPLLAKLAVHCFRHQSYPERELIIVDDGADEALADWLAANPDQRVRLIRLPDEGRPLGELRNVALKAARGEYIAQWDDDDLSAPLRLELQMAALDLFGARGCLLPRQTLWLPAARTLAKSTYRLWEGSALLSRDLVVGYAPLRRGEETAVIERIATSERVLLLDMPELYVYTFHGRNTFDQGHWLEHLQAATMRYDGNRYEPALREMAEWLGIRMERLGDYLSTRHMPAEAVGDSPQITQISQMGLNAEFGVLNAELEAGAGGREVGVVGGGEDPQITQIAQILEFGDDFPQERGVGSGAGAAAGDDYGDLPRLLVLTPVKDAAAHWPRYLAHLEALDYPPELLSLGILESDSRDGTADLVQAELDRLRERLRRVTFVQRDYGLVLDQDRWEPEVQRRRRGALARSRNALLQAALDDEAWVLWMDVDLLSWPADAARRLLRTGRRIVAANCLKAGSSAPFDLNSYQLAEDADSLDWSAYMVDGLLQPPPGFGRYYLTDFMDRDLVELDGVGGTMLLVDAELHRDGLIFPPVSYKGFIDTEGLAALAQDMGVRCWGLPGLVIRHS